MSTPSELELAIEACHFASVEAEFTLENFPLPQSLVIGTGLRVFRFRKEYKCNYMLGIMDVKSYKPGSLGDLLEYAKRPDRERARHIFALGAYITVRNERFYACIVTKNRLQHLDLLRFNKFPLSCRFLAVAVPKTV